MQIMNFTCPLPPSVNSYLGKRVAYSPITKKPFVQVYETAEAKSYKRYMKKVLERACMKSGWSKSGEFTYVICEMDVYLNQKRRDVDNLFKCMLDTLTENDIVYDDSMVIPRVKKVFIDKDNPRLEVTIRESSKVGVFANSKQLGEFEEGNCKRCSRFSKNCSIRKASLENKIKPEITKDENGVYSCIALKAKKGD